MTWDDSEDLEPEQVSRGLRRIVFLAIGFYGALGVGAFVSCRHERAAEAQVAAVETCPDSLLYTGCHPQWEVNGWYVDTLPPVPEQGEDDDR